MEIKIKGKVSEPITEVELTEDNHYIKVMIGGKMVMRIRKDATQIYAYTDTAKDMGFSEVDFS